MLAVSLLATRLCSKLCFLVFREPVTVEEPLEALCPKIGLQRVSPTGKPAKTEFERLSYNGESSVVKCECFFQSWI